MNTYTREDAVGKRVMVLLSGPVNGLAYVIALPCLTIGTLVSLLGGIFIRDLLNGLQSIVSFGWRPGEAHLAGKRTRKKR